MNCEKGLKRLQQVRYLVHEMLPTKVTDVKNQEALVRLSGVSTFASMLALKRGRDSEIAAIAGFLHDFYFYKTGIEDFPGPNSADTVRPILRGMQIFTDEELTDILRSIFYQEDRHQVHGPYEEITKNAIVLHVYFQNIGNSVSKADLRRLQNVLVELGIPEKHVQAEASIETEMKQRNSEDRRLILAEFAEMLAGQDIRGVPEDERYREIFKYWPDPDIYKVLEDNWCGAFVYYCCMQVGIRLPIRYPNHDYRLAGVGAWLDWARLPETGFFYADAQDGFTPERGDIVIYEKLLSDDSHDHIGIVLDCDSGKILVAEGNMDNKNFSSVLYRDRDYRVFGYIRIDNDYNFHFNGVYVPIR